MKPKRQKSRIEKLTRDQETHLAKTYEEWLTIGRSCEPLNREAVIRAVGEMYIAIGEEEERPTFMFFSSPIMCVLAYLTIRLLAKNSKKKDSQLRSQLGSQLYSQLRSQLRSQLYSQLDSQLRSQLGSQLYSQLRSQLDSQLGNRFAGAQWACWEVFYDFCRRIGVTYTESENASLNLWLEQSRACHWWWPYKGLVLASERHTELHVNAEGQLHRDGGPAVLYSDGWAVYALNGVRLDKEIVETSAAALDPHLISKTENAEVRREIVRKIGIERVCEGLNAKCLDRLDEYELLILDLGDGRSRPFLKMRNPSIGVYHIEGVAPECTTVQQALNFRNGLTPEMIDDVNGEEWIQQGDVILRPRGARKFQSRPVLLT